MTETILRGRVLRFLREPEGIDDAASYAYDEDGAILVRDGLVAAVGPAAEVLAQAGAGAPVVDHRPHLLMPGFIDTHIHMPQAQVIASWGAQLLDWLNTYTFPAEARFADPDHAARIAGAFLDELLRHGTTTAVAYCSVAPGLGRRLLRGGRGPQPAHDRRQGDDGPQRPRRRHATPPQSSYDDSKALIARWHGQGQGALRHHPALRHHLDSRRRWRWPGRSRPSIPTCYVQTHLSENRDEIAYHRSRSTRRRATISTSTRRYGLLGPTQPLRPLPSTSPIARRAAMAATGSVAVFCPTSNLFLGSGLFDDAGLARAAASAAPSPPTSAAAPTTRCSAPSTRATRCWRSAARSSTRCSAFYWITRGNARGARRSTTASAPSPPAPRPTSSSSTAAATPAMALRMETVAHAGRGALPARDPRRRPRHRRHLRHGRALAGVIARSAASRRACSRTRAGGR